mmetsp:Transcript_20151/g.43911  ORF Transcript_20151/g.43911 Transcript_20151/m.43911 type:complete len:90 (+) Transcript_20151:163-432(+)
MDIGFIAARTGSVSSSDPSQASSTSAVQGTGHKAPVDSTGSGETPSAATGGRAGAGGAVLHMRDVVEAVCMPESVFVQQHPGFSKWLLS